MAEIIVIGLGPGSVDSLPLGSYRILLERKPLYLRTECHPTVAWLKEQGIAFISCDRFYEESDQFEKVYWRIAEYLLHKAGEHGCLVYAVPGHPAMAERTVQLLREHGPSHGVQISMAAGQSFLDALFLRLGVDPVDGMTILDGTAFQSSLYNPFIGAVIVQVYSRDIASDVKLGLMEQLPDDHKVIVARALGVPDEEKVVTIPLYELDRVPWIDHLTSVYIPPATEEGILFRRFERLTDVVAKLRAPDGCPWDRQQTPSSLRRYVIEEAYEVADAIDQGDPEHLCEELGDLLLQVVLHAQIASEKGDFTIRDCVGELTRKLIRRHPHVFGDVDLETAQQVEKTWQASKDEEKKAKGYVPTSILDDIPAGFPGLLTAYKIQKKAASVGFDWDDYAPIVDKIREELEEVLEANEKAPELGDLLFAVVNLCRYYKVDPDQAISITNTKFRQRFRFIEEFLHKENLSFEEVNLEYLDDLWDLAKKNG